MLLGMYLPSPFRLEYPVRAALATGTDRAPAYDAMMIAASFAARGIRMRTRMTRRWLPLILLVPFAALLWPPLYNRIDPVIAGFPFFYVWQFTWVVLAALLTWIVHRRGRA
jgi:Protein of unknown function (DUF3311)